MNSHDSTRQCINCDEVFDLDKFAIVKPGVISYECTLCYATPDKRHKRSSKPMGIGLARTAVKLSDEEFYD